MPEFSPLTIYLDSNVLFSASYSVRSRFLRFWAMANVTPFMSLYAVDEVRRHVVLSAQQLRFDELTARTGLVSDPDSRLPATIRLAEKDRPILAAAIVAGADYLITGDKNDFAHLYLQQISRVYTMDPGDFLDLHKERFPL